MLSKGSKIIGPASAIALITFFMPWVLVSCENQPVASFTGWQLATGGSVETSLGRQPVPLEGSPSLFLVWLAAMGCLALVYLVYRQRLEVRKAAYGALGLAALSLLILLAKFATADTQPPTGGPRIDVQLRMQYGFWGTVLAYIAVIVGGVIDVKEEASQPEMSMEQTTPF